MTIEYGIKIPQSGVTLSGGYDPDIEWIVSASSSSASASVSSARSQLSGNEANSNSNTNSRIIGLSDNNVSISSGSFRRSSGNKRLPWEEAPLNEQNTQKVVHTVAPLKAFPLNDDSDSVSNGELIIYL